MSDLREACEELVEQWENELPRNGTFREAAKQLEQVLEETDE